MRILADCMTSYTEKHPLHDILHNVEKHPLHDILHNVEKNPLHDILHNVEKQPLHDILHNVEKHQHFFKDFMRCPDGAEGIKVEILRGGCLGGADVGQGGCVWPRAVTLSHQVKIRFPLHHRVPEKGQPTTAVKHLLRGISNLTRKFKDVRLSQLETTLMRAHPDERIPLKKKLKTPKNINNKKLKN